MKCESLQVWFAPSTLWFICHLCRRNHKKIKKIIQIRFCSRRHFLVTGCENSQLFSLLAFPSFPDARHISANLLVSQHWHPRLPYYYKCPSVCLSVCQLPCCLFAFWNSNLNAPWFPLPLLHGWCPYDLVVPANIILFMPSYVFVFFALLPSSLLYLKNRN